MIMMSENELSRAKATQMAKWSGCTFDAAMMMSSAEAELEAAHVAHNPQVIDFGGLIGPVTGCGMGLADA